VSTNIHIITTKLDAFIKRFYLNELIKGLILFVILFAFYFISIFLLEYFTYLSPTVRAILFYTSLIASLIGGVYYILIPVFHLLKIGKTLSYTDASKIISQHFPEVQDVLLNTLQLANQNSLENNSLAIAAINQKIAKLRPIPFALAVSYKSLSKYLKYAVALVILFVGSYIFYPEAFTSGAQRILNYNTVFEKPAPYNFIIENKDFTVTKGEDFNLKLRIEGEYVPQRVYFVIGSTSFVMQQISKNQFEYTIKSCNNSFSFYCKAEEYTSSSYTVNVHSLPQLLDFTLTADIPEYTNLQDFVFQNTGDIIVPHGTKLQWKLTTNEADSLSIFIDSDSLGIPAVISESNFLINYSAKKSTSYKIIASNEHFSNHKIIDYTITVTPDLHPSISVISKADSLKMFLQYFKGIIRDDYGFSKLQFVHYVSSKPDSIIKTPIEYASNTHIQEFFYMHDFSSVSRGDSIVYYFEVFDNDAISGPKSSRTHLQVFAIPSLEELNKQQDQLSKELEATMEKSSDLTDKVLDDIKDIQEKLLNKDLSDWDRKQLMQEMQQKQKSLKDQIQDMAEKFEKKNEMLEQFNPQSEEILKKQEQIQELLENLMDSELEKLFEEFNKLMEDFNKEEFFKNTEEMKMSFEELSKQLDRDLELLKRTEVEQKVENTANQLQELAEEQKKLAEDTKKGNKSDEELQKKQDEINKNLENIEQEYKDAQEKNEDLQDSFELPDFNEEFNDIKNQSEQSKQQLEQNQKNKSSKSMQQSSEQMQKLGDKMQQMMQQQSAQQQSEDMDNLRKIVDNLLNFSFEQEQLLSDTRKLSFTDPKYAAVASKQNALRENISAVKDSLYNLSLRVPEISSVINGELFDIHKNINYSLDYLEQRQRSAAIVKQQYVMTSTNNLILLLSEVLDQMQQQAAQQMSGQQQCQKPKPGQGKGGTQQMKQMQQSLKDQMQQMLNQMQNGGMPQKQQAQQLSEMLAKQQMMKQMMNEMMKNGNLSPNGMNELKEIQKIMDQVEQDIVYQNVTQQTITRQEQILTRLLESERAENERDKDKKRESKESQDISSSPENIFKEKNIDEIQYEDVLEQTNLKLKSYYKKIFNDYLFKINQN